MVISASDDDSIARAAAPGGVTQQPPRNGAAPGECRRLPVALKTACMVGIDHGRWHGRHAVDAAENKALIRRFYAEIDAGNIDAMDALVAEDYVDHNPPPFPGLRSPCCIRGFCARRFSPGARPTTRRRRVC